MQMDPRLWLIHKHAQTPPPIGSIRLDDPSSAAATSNRNVCCCCPQIRRRLSFSPGISYYFVVSCEPWIVGCVVGWLFRRLPFGCLSPSAAFINKPAEISLGACSGRVSRSQPSFLSMSAILHKWQSHTLIPINIHTHTLRAGSFSKQSNVV